MSLFEVETLRDYDAAVASIDEFLPYTYIDNWATCDLISPVVEILSPSTKGKDLAAKLNLYMKSGILEYWVVNAENRSILQYSFSKERDIDNLMGHPAGRYYSINCLPGFRDTFIRCFF